jgi:hypothetical protein
MFGLRSPSSLRNVALAGVTGAGVALVGLSLANVASMDGTLAAATQQAKPIRHTTQVSFVTKRNCPREHHRTAPASDVQY